MDDEEHPADPDLLHQVAEACRRTHPLALLELASGTLGLADERDALGEQPPVDLDALLESLLAVDREETTALLTALAALLPDRLRAQRIVRDLRRRSSRPPRGVRRLAPLTPHTPVAQRHVLGDSEQVLLGVTTAGGHPLTLVVLLDHNAGGALTEAFALEAPLADVRARTEQLGAEEPGTWVEPLDPATARAIVERGVAAATESWPPVATETYPGCRALLERVLRELPAGGALPAQPAWSEHDRQALIDRMLASPHAPDAPREAAEDLLHVLLWQACDHGPGDALRWSPPAVEIALEDFLPRKLSAPETVMRHGPEVLAALVRFAHAERGVPTELTDETLATVERFAPAYLSRVEGREGGIAEAVADRADVPELAASLAELRARAAELDRRAVGGQERLDALDDEPLPDEPLDERVPADVLPRLRRVGRLIDDTADALLDVEHRTAARRVLSDAVRADPDLLRGRSRDATLAAVVCWLVGGANDAFDQRPGGLTVKRLLAHLGVSGSARQRAAPWQAALGVEQPDEPQIVLGDPRYLTGARRAALIARRDERA